MFPKQLCVVDTNLLTGPVQLTFAAGFGGGGLSALLFMRPDEVPINMFVYNIDLIWTLVWWSINYFPFSIPGRIQKLLPVRMATKFCLNVRPLTCSNRSAFCALISQSNACRLARDCAR